MNTIELLEKMKGVEYRNWTFLVYPDSAPSDWVQILNNLHLVWCHSPLHHGYKHEDFEERKDHYHVIIFFDGKKSFKNIFDITQLVNGTIPKKVESKGGLIRYLLHLDNPEKEQFDDNQTISCYGGCEVQEYLESIYNRDEVIHQMEAFCKKNMITEYPILKDYAYMYHRRTWYHALNLNCREELKSYITSLRNMSKRGICYSTKHSDTPVFWDTASGEILDLYNFEEI